MNSKTESSIHIKRILLIRRHQQQLENRMLSLLNKRYTLESLNVTKDKNASECHQNDIYWVTHLNIF